MTKLATWTGDYITDEIELGVRVATGASIDAAKNLALAKAGAKVADNQNGPTRLTEELGHPTRNKRSESPLWSGHQVPPPHRTRTSLPLVLWF